MTKILCLLPIQLFSPKILTSDITANEIDKVVLYKHKKFFTNVCRSKWVFLNACIEEYSTECKSKDINIAISETRPKGDLFIYDIPDLDISAEFKKARVIRSPYFILDDDDRDAYITNIKIKSVFTNFYKMFRTKYEVLMKNSKPVGGEWSFDKLNQGVPKGKTLDVKIYKPKVTNWQKWVDKSKEKNNKGILYNTQAELPYATTRKGAISALINFAKTRLAAFGDYQDFYDSENWQVNHSVLSMYLNVGLLTPKSVIDYVIKYASVHKIKINSLEGFIRQLFWRDYMYLIYYRRLSVENFFNSNKKLPVAVWKGETGILPVDHAIAQTISTGYLHHIGRLMILGSYFLMAEVHPHQVFEWFNQMFIDAYDWVMWGNVYCMSQFADGGMHTTRPYFSSSKYLLKMTNFPSGDWCEKWDELFNNFLVSKKNKLKKLYLVSRWV